MVNVVVVNSLNCYFLKIVNVLYACVIIFKILDVYNENDHLQIEKT